ncbi:hypothetical protein AgCh_001462 [Apium graveolens]
MEGFKQTIEECGLEDLGFEGEAFTWERARGTERWVQERLDRGMANVDWLELFPSAVVKVLEVSSSDHLPLYLMLNRQVYVPKVKRFRFENMWIKEDECRNIVLDCWHRMDVINIMDKMLWLFQSGGEGACLLERERVRVVIEEQNEALLSPAYWSIVAEDVIRFCQDFLENGTLSQELNRILSAFLEGRLLTDNTLIAFEVNHSIHRRTQGKTGVAGLKIDISKAYDRLEWGFIESMLSKFGFHSIWVSRLMTCIT